MHPDGRKTSILPMTGTIKICNRKFVEGMVGKIAAYQLNTQCETEQIQLPMWYCQPEKSWKLSKFALDPTDMDAVFNIEPAICPTYGNEICRLVHVSYKEPVYGMDEEYLQRDHYYLYTFSEEDDFEFGEMVKKAVGKLYHEFIPTGKVEILNEIYRKVN